MNKATESSVKRVKASRPVEAKVARSRVGVGSLGGSGGVASVGTASSVGVKVDKLHAKSGSRKTGRASRRATIDFIDFYAVVIPTFILKHL